MRSTGNFDFVQSSKTESQAKEHESATLGTYRTFDMLLLDNGWTEDNKNTPFGERLD